MKRRLALAYLSAFLVVVLVVLVGCDNIFRPVVNPIPQNGGTPAVMKLAFILSNTGPTTPGYVSALDVSGDTNIGEMQVGRGPLSFAVTSSGQTVYVANQADSSISLVAGFIPNSVSPLTLEQTVTNLPSGLLSCSASPCSIGNPMVVTTNNLYVTEGSARSGQGVVAVLSTAGGPSFSGEILTGTTPTTNSIPTQLISVPSVNKVYSLNTTSNDLTSWNDQNTSVVNASIPVGTTPVAAAANGAGTKLFVANSASGTVSVIDTATDTKGTDIIVGTQPSALFVNNQTNQLFVANKGTGPGVGSSISIVNIALPQATAMPTPTPPSTFGTVTSTINIPQGQPIGVVATNDGSRVFVLSVDSTVTPPVPYLYEIALVGSATPVADAVPTPSPVPTVTPVTSTVTPTPTPLPTPQLPTAFQLAISSDGTKVYVIAQAPSQQPFYRIIGTGSNSQTISYLAPAANVFAISTQNDTVTNTTNTFSSISVPQQSNAIPIQIIVQQ